MSSQIGFDPKTFDPKKHLLNAPPRHDPWARSDLWRYYGPFSRLNRFRGAFPGFGTAAVAFAVYCAYEVVFLKDDHHEGDGHHAPGQKTGGTVGH